MTLNEALAIFNTTDFRLPAKDKAAWLAELRGGKVKQAHGALIDLDGRMCCLGVLAKAEGCMGELEEARDGVKGPDKVQTACLADVFGKASYVGSLLPNNIADALAFLNDNEDPYYTFEQIADLIEKHL